MYFLTVMTALKSPRGFFINDFPGSSPLPEWILVTVFIGDGAKLARTCHVGETKGLSKRRDDRFWGPLANTRTFQN